MYSYPTWNDQYKHKISDRFFLRQVDDDWKAVVNMKVSLHFCATPKEIGVRQAQAEK